jgi:NADP-dependent 3-hydroxy acid dehydrogenase YdfG
MLSEAELNTTIDLNLQSCLNWIQPVVPHMQAAGYGRIVSRSSLSIDGFDAGQDLHDLVVGGFILTGLHFGVRGDARSSDLRPRQSRQPSIAAQRADRLA